MIKHEKSHVVSEMHSLKAETDLTPKPFELAVKTKAYDICKTLVALKDKNINQTISKIVDNSCNFEKYIESDCPEVTAALFSRPDWLICESYQLTVLKQIFKFIKQRENDKAFYLIKVVCGPINPFHLIRGLGMQKEPSDKLPSIIQDKKKLSNDYKQCLDILNKCFKNFEKHIYMFTSTADAKSLERTKLKLNSNEAYKFSVIR